MRIAIARQNGNATSTELMLCATRSEPIGYRCVLPFFCSPPAWILMRVGVPDCPVRKSCCVHWGY